MFADSVFHITVTGVVSANRLLKSPIGVTTCRHNRERWAIALKCSGKTYYYQDGNEILSDCLHAVIMPKGSTYSWKCTEPGECVIIEFDAPQTESELFSFEIADSSFITSAFSKIEKSLNSRQSVCQLECKHLLYGILLTLFRSVHKEYVPKDRTKLLQPAMDCITERYYDSTVTNTTLAALCGISTVYFRKVFETVYGMSPIKYLHTFRISKAKAILLSDYTSISQIAESVGYNSIYHFSKMFKAYTGISPTEFREQKGS